MRLAVTFVLATAYALGVAACALGEFKVHVSADAKAGGNGEERSPYQTLTQARDGIRQPAEPGHSRAGRP